MLVEAGIAAQLLIWQLFLLLQRFKSLKSRAQNCYFENAGAFTGETSHKFLKEIGTDYVVIGPQNAVTTSMKHGEDINKSKSNLCKRYASNHLLCLITWNLQLVKRPNS